MSRSAPSRSAVLMFVIASLVSCTIASAENIAVLRLESFDAVLADARRVIDAVKHEGSAEELMQPLLELLQFPGLICWTVPHLWSWCSRWRGSPWERKG